VKKSPTKEVGRRYSEGDSFGYYEVGFLLDQQREVSSFGATKKGFF